MTRLLAIALTTCAMLLMPEMAQAANSVSTCAANYGYSPQPSDFTILIVMCLQNSVIDATGMMLSALSAYMAPIVGGLATILIATLGIRILGGERGLLGKSAGIIIRLVLVTIFSFNLGGLAPSLFAVENELIALTSRGFSPWNQIDAFLGNLLGFGSGLTLFQGMIGIIGTALTSSFTGAGSSLGSLMFLSGFMAIMNLLLFIMDVLYTYVSAIIIMGFLLIISPIIVPLALFNYTERHFKKWVDLMISAMLMPALLFASMYLFLGIFDQLIQNVYATLGGHDFRAYWKTDQPVGTWMMQGDNSSYQQLKHIAQQGSTNASPLQTVPPVQTSMYSMMQHAFNGSSIANIPTINFGQNNVGMMQSLSFSFIQLFIFAALMKKVVYQMPALAGSLAGVMTQIPMFSAGSFMDRAKNLTANLRTGAGVMAGGMLGGEAGAMVGKTQQQQMVNRRIGSAVGALVGGTKASENARES